MVALWMGRHGRFMELSVWLFQSKTIHGDMEPSPGGFRSSNLFHSTWPAVWNGGPDAAASMAQVGLCRNGVGLAGQRGDFIWNLDSIS